MREIEDLNVHTNQENTGTRIKMAYATVEFKEKYEFKKKKGQTITHLQTHTQTYSRARTHNFKLIKSFVRISTGNYRL